MPAIAIVDESTNGAPAVRTELRLSSSSLTLRELIAEKVRLEVERYKRKRSQRFAAPVVPGEFERTLNGEPTSGDLITEDQVLRAWTSFEKKGFLVIADGRGVESLDEELKLRDGDEVRFVRLVPLMGG